MKNYYFDNNKLLRPFTFETEANENSKAPSNALRIVPEFKAGFWPCEKDGVWIEVEDHRSATVYSTTTGDKVDIKEVGALPDDVTDQPRPDPYHTWDTLNSAWVMTGEAIAQKQTDEKEQDIITAKLLLAEANKQIEILQDRVDLDDYESDDELAQIQADLKAWKKYRIELNKFIKGEREDLPNPVISESLNPSFA